MLRNLEFLYHQKFALFFAFREKQRNVRTFDLKKKSRKRNSQKDSLTCKNEKNVSSQKFAMFLPDFFNHLTCLNRYSFCLRFSFSWSSARHVKYPRLTNELCTYIDHLCCAHDFSETFSVGQKQKETTSFGQRAQGKNGMSHKKV